jgi:antitoxin component HigA of HigAB toxin-antitoxin module
MKTMHSHLPDRMPTRFKDLNGLHRLRPINDKIDLTNAFEVIDRLAILNRRTKDQNDYLETLILLTESFQAAEIADALDRSKSSGLDALKYLMQARQMKQADLAKLLKISVSAVSVILSGYRPITADHARNLARHFAISPAAFI